MKLLGLACALTFLSISAIAQTANDLNTKYGAAHGSYEIRPGIFATVKFATDGRACEITIEKRHVQTSGTINVDSTFLSVDETKPLIEELVPLNERGKETDLSGLIRINGPGMITTYNYQNVSIIYYGNVVQRKRRTKDIVIQGTAAVVIQWKNRGCN